MKKFFLPLGIFLCVCLFFFFPVFKGEIPFPGDLLVNTNPYRSLSILGYGPNSFPNKAQGQDVIAETYPWRYFTIQELKQGRIPFWNPHNFSGNILMQNLQSSVFNPFNILFFIFPFTTGWTLFILIQPLLASFFFYLFARELKLSRFASIIGSVGFAFSSYMTVWMEYGNIAATFAYLPLLLFFLLRFFREKKVRYYAGFIVTGVLLLLSGYIQGAFYSYSISALFAVYLFIEEKKKFSIHFFVALLGMFLFPLFLTLFQYLPTLEIFSQSTRWPYSVHQFQTMLEPVWYWITLFASDFFGNPATRNYFLKSTYIESVAYVGIPLLFFAIYAVLLRKKMTTFLFSIAILVMLLATNFPGIAYVYTLPIPVIDTTVPTRSLSIFMFVSVVLAAIGIDEFFKKKKIPKKLIIIFLGIYGIIWVGIFIAKKLYPQFLEQIVISQHNFIIPTVLIFGTCLVVLLTKKYEKLAKGLLFILVVVDLFYVFQKITPFSPIQTIYPENPITLYMQQHAGINRYWGYGSGYIEPNFQTVDGTYSPEGNDPLHVGRYGELLASSANGKLSPLPPRPDANIAPGYGPNGMIENPYRQTILDLLGVKYVVQHDETQIDNHPDTQTFPSTMYTMVWSKNPWQIYENNHALPRYFLVNKYVVAQNQQALDKLYSLNLAKTVILSHRSNQHISATAHGSVSLVSYGSQKIVFTTNTNGNMLLFLSDTYYPSWKATIDGSKTPILLADYAFRAVVVPKGKHTIVMQYVPDSFRFGLLIAAFSGIGFLLSLVLLKRYE